MEEMEDSVYHPKGERDETLAFKEEAEGSEDEMEEGFPDQGTEEDEEGRNREGDEGEDAANEPQDLSLVDYSQFDGAALPESHMVTGADGTFAPRAAPPRVQAPGKLNCDICGLSCVSINVLLVHKRSHTGEYRNTPRKPDLKHKCCNSITVLMAQGDKSARRQSTR